MKYLHIMTDVYLPISCGMQKKLSIPTTVCQVLDYIPELQKQVEDLEKKKQELTRAKCRERLQRVKDNTGRIVSATPLDGNEIMVQVSLLSNMAASLPLSKCINVFENKGLHLISSSTFSTEVNRTFYSFHFEVHFYMRPSFPVHTVLTW